jgi:hypothetical protein
MKMFLQSLLGLALTLGGVYVMFLYIISLDTNVNILFLVGSLLLIAGGVFFLIRAGKADTIILKRTSKEEKDIDIKAQVVAPIVTEKDEGLAKKIEENNKLLDDWKKTKETQQRLKMLEMSAGSE